MEVYWRAQKTITIELTPDFQVYFDRASGTGPLYFGAISVGERARPATLAIGTACDERNSTVICIDCYGPTGKL